MAYFECLDDHRFPATDEVSGAWRVEEQHIAPALGLLAHVVEVVELDVRVVRAGRTIELVEASLRHQGRDIVLLRAWLMQPGETAHVAGTPLPAMSAPGDVPA